MIMKKILSIVLALAMLTSVLTLTATAAEKVQLDVKWNQGWAVISPANCYDSQFDEDYEAASGFASTDVFTVPKAGTKITWTDPASDFAANSVLIVSSWKQENGAWVLDRDGAMMVGAGGDSSKASTAEVVSGGKVNYTYITSTDNENIRLCVKAPDASSIAVYAEETNAPVGSWTRIKNTIDAFHNKAIPVNTTNWGAIAYEDVSDQLTWNYGYVGSGTHSSQKNKIKDNSYEYIYSSVLTIPKAGTTVYVFDDNVYASDTAATFSWWKKAGNSWLFDTSKPSLDANTANQKMFGSIKMYWYTTTEDNENMRFCTHGVHSDYAISVRPKVCIAQPFSATPITATGALTAASYTDRTGGKVDYKIYLPEGFKAGDNVKTLFSIGGDTAVADALVAAKTEYVVITANVEAAVAADMMDVLVTTYGLNPHMFYLYGADTVKAACKDVFCATMSSTAGYATAKEAGEALLANRSKYYGILDGINMYAMGDSYFGGSAVRKGITWVNQMGNKYGMDYINYGIGGSTMSAYVTNKDPMCLRYRTMEKGPCDLILLEGGRNDRSVLVPIGTNDTRDIKTFKGAVNTMIDGMLKTYPDALIVLVTAWYNTAKTSAGKSNVDFANALRELAEYRNDPRVICLYAADKNATGVDMDSAAFRAKYCCTSSDVSHLNGAGMEMIQPYMEKFLAEALAEYKGLTVDGEPIPAEPEVTTPAETDLVPVPEDTTPAPAETTPAEATPVETTPAPVEKTGCGGVIGGAVALVALISVAGCAVLKKNKE